MKNQYLGKILVIDNDVLVYLLKNNFELDPDNVHRVINYIALQYSRVWIPSTVLNEFTLRRNEKKRQKRLDNIMEEYEFFSECPIKTGINEIQLMIGNSEEDAGEAEAIIQIQKALSSENHVFQEIRFLTNDNGAIKMAEDYDIEVWKYKDLKIELRELGLTLN